GWSVRLAECRSRYPVGKGEQAGPPPPPENRESQGHARKPDEPAISYLCGGGPDRAVRQYPQGRHGECRSGRDRRLQQGRRPIMNIVSTRGAERLVHVPLGERAYDILIGADLIKRAGGEFTARLRGRRAAIITDEHVGPLYLEALTDSLQTDGVETVSLTLPAGEKT